MGDADIAQNMLPREADDNIEMLLDEAATEVDDEIDRLFSFINLLHIRLCYALLEIASWRKVGRCFTAFNLLVIPVVVAMGIVYISAGLRITNSIQHGLETFVMILMYTAMGAGLPLYIASLWDLCYEPREEEDILNLKSEIENTDTAKAREFTLDDVQESLRNIGQFQALSRAIYQRTSRISNRSLQEDWSGEEEERDDNLSDGSDGFKVETPAAYNKRRIKLASPKIVDLDFDDSNVDTGYTSHHELDELHVLKFITDNSKEDMMSMDDDVTESRSFAEKLFKQGVVGKPRRRKSLRTITIQNIGDCNNVAYKKDTCSNTADSHFFLDTTFGL